MTPAIQTCDNLFSVITDEIPQQNVDALVHGVKELTMKESKKNSGGKKTTIFSLRIALFWMGNTPTSAETLLTFLLVASTDITTTRPAYIQGAGYGHRDGSVCAERQIEVRDHWSG